LQHLVALNIFSSSLDSNLPTGARQYSQIFTTRKVKTWEVSLFAIRLRFFIRILPY
jgi:hypothetical protein